MTEHFDLVILGSGPGGYVAAIRAGQCKLKTAIIERENLGGVCLNWGCIPTKALLRSAEVLRLAKHAKTYGVELKDVKPDSQAMINRSRQVANQLANGVQFLLKKNNVAVLHGTGKLTGGDRNKRQIEIQQKDGSKKTLTATSVILATGARAKEIKGMEADGVKVWNYRHALQPPIVPKEMIILGSGAIGIEFASFYHELGVKVTVVELLPRILPQEDHDISAAAEKALTGFGIMVKTSTTAEKLTKTAKGIELAIKNSQGKTEQLTGDVLLSAVGITPNSEEIGLANYPAIQLNKGFVAIDSFCQTQEPGIFAIGDLAQTTPWLAHKAEHEAVIAVETIAKIANVKPLNYGIIPACTYCHPQIASIGLTEQKAKAQGLPIRVGKFPFQANGKAIANGEPYGFIKTIFHQQTGELLGAHMIGSEVTELIHSFSLAHQLETTEAEFIHAVFPHPTLSEMIAESVMSAMGQALHI